MLSQREKFRKENIWMLRVWKLFPLKLSPGAYDMENFVYPRIPCFGNTVWMIQYSNDFLNFGWSFHELPMWPVVLISDKSIGMGFLKMGWTDEKCNLKSKWREFDKQRQKGISTSLRNGGWWDVVLKVLCGGAHSLHQLRTGKRMESKLWWQDRSVSAHSPSL